MEIKEKELLHETDYILSTNNDLDAFVNNNNIKSYDQ